MSLSKTSPRNSRGTGPPARTPEAREQQMIALAMDLVEERIRNGTASSQETTHFLKLGSTTAKFEKKILENQAELYKAKTEALKSAKHQEELFAKALAAMSEYKGGSNEED